MQGGKDRQMGDGKYRVVSFFSGCGGLDLGFLGGFEYRGEAYPELPFDIVAAYDFNDSAVRTYRSNISKDAQVCDLSSAKPASMPPADVLLGGFPCQEFSVCGPRKGLESDRGQLYKAMVRYARAHKPAVIVGENVANLLYINDGWDFSVIRREFSRAGYRSLVWEVNAADYGVPQSRRRVIVIFIRKDIVGQPALPDPAYARAQRSASWAISDLELVSDESVPNQSQYFKAAKAGNGHGQGDEITKADRPGYTIRANAKSRIQFHYSLPRRLTVRECARLQTFPDTFVFPSGATEAIRQIGNAVPPVLGYRVAEAISLFLNDLASELIATQGGGHGG